ncbi:MAG: hypothetical protein IVW36_05420 [Dehalococcoidia bacterium]|nr:hypothetical protein [Dehalococcoidia bacterium]
MNTLRTRPLAPLLALSLVFGVGCRAQSVDQTVGQARSDIVASAFALERYADGASTRTFTQASIQQYAAALRASAATLRGSAAGTKEAAAVADARSVLAALSAGITKDAARSAASRLRADAAKLSGT